MSYTRFAFYVVPDEDHLADFGARWLGWDIRSAAAVDPFPIAGLDDVTMTPRKYGFHGTIKPPFRLAEGYSRDDLDSATAALAAQLAPVQTEGLQVSFLGGFLALTPVGDTGPLGHLAARFVRDLDRFRAAATEDELARRRAAGLSPVQEANLKAWGYPYVLADFQFHLTLTGRLAPEARRGWMEKATELLPAQPVPFAVQSIALVGEQQDGRFALLHRHALTG